MSQPAPMLQIADRVVGAGQPAFVIAEIGVNHDGSLHKALELVDIAAECGADAVKLQIFQAATLLHSSAQMAEYQKSQNNIDSPLDLLRRCELSIDDLQTIVRHINQRQMVPLATPFSP